MSRTQKPFRRKVFYIPGYDPFPPRRYRELYRAEGTAQAAISGYHITMQPSPPPPERQPPTLWLARAGPNRRRCLRC
jgi:hypothetical protein